MWIMKFKIFYQDSIGFQAKMTILELIMIDFFSFEQDTVDDTTIPLVFLTLLHVSLENCRSRFWIFSF